MDKSFKSVAFVGAPTSTISRDELAELYGEDLLFMDGYDDCILGVVQRFGQPSVVCYDKDRIIDKLANEDGMTFEDAEEFFMYNQLGSWVGENTPCFLTKTN